MFKNNMGQRYVTFLVKKLAELNLAKSTFTFLLKWRSNLGQISILWAFSESLDPEEFKYLLIIEIC